MTYKIEAEPEFPAPNAHNSYVYYWVNCETGERHGPYQFLSGAQFSAQRWAEQQAARSTLWSISWEL